jgi:hypothetical protein
MVRDMSQVSELSYARPGARPRRLGRAAALVVSAAAVAALCGCQAPVYDIHYEIGVTPSVVESNAPEEGPKTSDLAATITWTLTSHSLEAFISNPADSTAAIMWSGATFAYDGGEPEPLISSAPSSSPELPQAPTLVPRKGQVALDTIPRGAAEWKWMPNRAMGGSWRADRDIMGVSLSEGASKEDMEKAALETVGKKIRIRIPFRIGHRNITNSYEIRITGAEVERVYH